MASEKIALGIVTGTYTEGWVGTYTVGTTSTKLAVAKVEDNTDMTTDPRVFPIRINDNPRALVNSYDYNGTGELGQPGRGLFGIYDPTTDTWVRKQQAQCYDPSGTPAPFTGIQQWSTTNPYGLATIGTDMYLLPNDSHPTNRTCSIYKYNMVNDAFSEYPTPVYTFSPDIPGDSTQWKGAGYGLDLYYDNDEDEYYLIAVFARFTNAGWSYTYGDSEIVKIKISDGSETTATVGKNVSGVVVNGSYAYVTSFGGPQRDGGAQDENGEFTSKIEIFDISGVTPVLHKTITVADIKPFTVTGKRPNGFEADFLDVAVSNGKVYILIGKYDLYYTKYEYIIICIDVGNFNNGILTGAKVTITFEAIPASPCFALLPGEGNNLYLVDGVNIKSIDTSKSFEDVGAITPLKVASDFTKGALVGGLINTAAVVMERTVPAPTMRMAAGAVKASVTKIAKRLARPDELERKE